MKYAVIELSGHQYKVTEGQRLQVNKLDSFKPMVLMYSDGEKFELGNPYLDTIEVSAEVNGEVKGKKLTITRFKAKSRYDKTIGFRPVYTDLTITSIHKKGVGAEKKTEKKIEKKVDEPNMISSFGLSSPRKLGSIEGKKKRGRPKKNLVSSIENWNLTFC